MNWRSNIIAVTFFLISNIILSNLFNTLFGNFNIASSILIVIDSFFLIFLISKLKLSGKIKIILIASFILRIILLYFDMYGKNVLVLPNSGFDTESFDNQAWTMNFTELTGYALFLKVIYTLFGHERLFAQYLNIIFMMISMLVVLKIMTKLSVSKKIQERTIAIFAFLPSNLIISAILLRESFIVLFSTISLYTLVSYSQHKKTVNLLLTIFFVFLAAYLHSGMIGLLIPYAFYLVFYSKEYGFRFNLRSVIRFIMVAATVYGIYLLIGTESLTYFDNLNTIDATSIKMSGYIDGGSVYLPFTSNITSIWQIILYSPLKFIYFFGSPMPWDWRGFNDIFTFMLGSIVYLNILIKMFMQKHKSDILKILLFCVVILGLIYGWGCFNAGTAMRHREVLLVFLLIGYSQCKKGISK